VVASNGNFTFIGGGACNRIDGDGYGIYSFVGGGCCNVVGADYSAIIGGAKNTITGTYSAAFGCNLNGIANCTFYVNNLFVSGTTQVSCSLAVGNISTSATIGRIDASNDIVAFSTSDIGLKEHITPILNPLEKVLSLNGVEFLWKNEKKNIHGYEGNDVGIIAQDVLNVIPQAVRKNDSGYYSVRYEKLIPLLIEAIKEQQKQINEIKQKLNATK
jgi:hypothetical protein